MHSTQQFYVGTYTQSILFGTGEVMHGKGQGIYLADIDPQSGLLRCNLCQSRVDNPSFLCFNAAQTNLYAVNELKEFQGEAGGSVSAFAVMPDKTLRFLNSRPTKGLDPCHVAVDPMGSCVVVANFMSGSIAVYPVLKDGNLAEMSQFVQHTGKGADAKRQAGPHAHSAVFHQSGRFLLVPDLGIDAVLIYKVQRANCTLAPVARYQTPPGGGPRYCSFHPSLPVCYLINELNSSISALCFSEETGELTHLQTITTLVQPFFGDNICVDLHLTANGKYLYASNRGHDSLVVYHVQADGSLCHVQTIASGGKTPRNFALLVQDKFLVAANQDSDNLTSFSVDANTGLLTPVHTCDVSSPVCVCSF